MTLEKIYENSQISIFICENSEVIIKNKLSTLSELSITVCDKHLKVSRNKRMQTELNNIRELIKDRKINEARKELKSLSNAIGSTDPDVVRMHALINFMEV
jgi:uncharacterized protein YciW